MKFRFKKVAKVAGAAATGNPIGVAQAMTSKQISHDPVINFLDALDNTDVQQRLRYIIQEELKAYSDGRESLQQLADALEPVPEPETMLERVKRHEGEERDSLGNHKPYKCPAGRWTTGWGHNLEANHPSEWQSMIERHWTDEQCEEWLEDDLEAAENRCRRTCRHHDVDFEALPEPVQEALVEMAFQLGNTRAWTNMWDAIKEGSWTSAAYHSLDSKWAKIDTPDRAAAVAHFLSNLEVSFLRDPNPAGGPASFTGMTREGRPVALG